MLIISGKEIPTDILFNDVFPVLLVNGKALVANPKKVNPSTVTFNTIGTKVSNEEPDKVYFVKKVGPLNKTGEEQVFLVLIEDFEKSKVAPWKRTVGREIPLPVDPENYTIRKN